MFHTWEFPLWSTTDQQSGRKGAGNNSLNGGVGLAFNLLIAGFVAYVMTGFSYTIDGVNLLIKGGFRWKATIAISTITKIVETNNPISSPAASLDRLAIHYNIRNAVMISPKDKKSFVGELLKINPAIEVKWKKG